MRHWTSRHCAQVSVTQPPQVVQLASSYRRQFDGWWSALLDPGTYKVTAHVPHRVCASVVLTIPLPRAGEEEAERQEVRIYCK